jgi:hypothetical protein
VVKIRKPETDTDHELAQARVKFAEAMLAADNTSELLLTLNDLFVAQVTHTLDARVSGKKSEARRRKQAADEIFTIMMCAAYRAQSERE